MIHAIKREVTYDSHFSFNDWTWFVGLLEFGSNIYFWQFVMITDSLYGC